MNIFFHCLLFDTTIWHISKKIIITKKNVHRNKILLHKITWLNQVERGIIFIGKKYNFTASELSWLLKRSSRLFRILKVRFKFWNIMKLTCKNLTHMSSMSLLLKEPRLSKIFQFMKCQKETRDQDNSSTNKDQNRVFVISEYFLICMLLTL